MVITFSYVLSAHSDTLALWPPGLHIEGTAMLYRCSLTLRLLLYDLNYTKLLFITWRRTFKIHYVMIVMKQRQHKLHYFSTASNEVSLFLLLKNMDLTKLLFPVICCLCISQNKYLFNTLLFCSHYFMSCNFKPFFLAFCSSSVLRSHLHTAAYCGCKSKAVGCWSFSGEPRPS